MNPDFGSSPRLHPETAPIFRAAAGRPFTGEELDEICRVFPGRAKPAALVFELWEASTATLGPSPAGAPSPREFRAELAARGQAAISGDSTLDEWPPGGARASGPLLLRLGRAWAEVALHRLDASTPTTRQPNEWTPVEWTDWLRGWFGQRGWQLESDFSSAPADGVMDFRLHAAQVPRGHFWPSLLAGALGGFGSRLGGAHLEGACIGEGALDTAPSTDGSPLLFLVTSPARAAEAGAMAADGQEPGAIRAALRRTKPLPAPEPAATGGAP